MRGVFDDVEKRRAFTDYPKWEKRTSEVRIGTLNVTGIYGLATKLLKFSVIESFSRKKSRFHVALNFFNSPCLAFSLHNAIHISSL